MKVPTHYIAIQTLLLQLADNGREHVLLGDGLARIRKVIEPFMVGEKFPDVYLEFPLAGEPFLDMTLLYKSLKPGTHVDDPAAEGTADLFDWYAKISADYDNISFGVELDTSKAELPNAAVHFQPRTHIELVEPFFEVLGEPERAKLYLDLAARMPAGWALSFFGIFRGRPDSPLRVCGYLTAAEKATCADNPARVADVFDTIGFTAYDDTMLAEVARLIATAPGALDFQFDVYPDGHLGEVFAIDAQFGIEQPEAVQASFKDGDASHIMALFEEWGITDQRWHLAVDATFARALPVECDDGTIGRYLFTLFPLWAKVRWRNKVLQPSKLYCSASAGLAE